MCRFISIAVEDTDEAKLIFAGYQVWENINKSFNTDFRTTQFCNAFRSQFSSSIPVEPFINGYTRVLGNYTKPLTISINDANRELVRKRKTQLLVSVGCLQTPSFGSDLQMA